MARKTGTAKTEKKTSEHDVHIMISENLYFKAKLLAAATDRSLSQFLKECLQESLEKKCDDHKKDFENIVRCLTSDN